MAELTLTSEDFTDGDDSVIYTPGTPIEVDEFGQIAIALGSEDFSEPEDLTTGLGDDTIIGYGPFVPGALGTISKDAYGIYGSTVSLGSAIIEPDGPISDDDTLIGLASGGFNTRLYGIKIGQLMTGMGNDLIIGAALAYDNTSAVGYSSNTIDTGSGSDAVIGIGLNIWEAELSGSNNAGGISGQANIVMGTGADLLVGVGIGSVADVGDFSNSMLARGIDVGGGGTIRLGGAPLEDGEDTSPNLVIGVGFTQSSGTGDAQETRLISNGLQSGNVIGDQGSDVVVGVAAILAPDLEGLDGVTSFGIRLLEGDTDLGGGDDILAGISYVQAGAEARFRDTPGLQLESDVAMGNGNDLVLGVSWMESTNGVGRFLGHFGIGTFSTLNGATITTGIGDDIVIGIAQSIASAPEVTELNKLIYGIRNVSIDTGADNDILIGIGTRGGIWMEAPEEPDLDADIVIEPNIDLGSGDDFVFARGEVFGVENVAIAGGAGNDVFDIQSGTGAIAGGDDIDTLVLVGDFEDFSFTDLTSNDADQINGAVLIEDDGAPFETELFVMDVEFFQFDDQIVSYGNLFPVA